MDSLVILVALGLVAFLELWLWVLLVIEHRRYYWKD